MKMLPKSLAVKKINWHIDDHVRSYVSWEAAISPEVKKYRRVIRTSKTIVVLMCYVSREAAISPEVNKYRILIRTLMTIVVLMCYV